MSIWQATRDLWACSHGEAVMSSDLLAILLTVKYIPYDIYHTTGPAGATHPMIYLCSMAFTKDLERANGDGLILRYQNDIKCRISNWPIASRYVLQDGLNSWKLYNISSFRRVRILSLSERPLIQAVTLEINVEAYTNFCHITFFTTELDILRISNSQGYIS